MKRIIKSIFRKPGTSMTEPSRNIQNVVDSELNRSVSPPIRPLHKPLCIEFIGASGVGKTTLYKAVEEIKSNEDNWIERKEFLKNNDTPLRENNPVYESLAECKFRKIIAREYSLSDKLNILPFFFQNLNEEIRMHSLNKHYTVISEDGLFHNFGDCLSELLLQNISQFMLLAENRAVVFCNSSPENIATQILKRQNKSGQIRPQHIGIEFTELVRKQKTILENKAKFAADLKKSGVPVLEINTADNLYENARKVNAFIRQLQQELKDNNK